MKKLILSSFVFMLVMTSMIEPMSLSAEEVKVIEEVENLKEGRLAPSYACNNYWETYGTKENLGLAYGSWVEGPIVSSPGRFNLANSVGRTKTINVATEGEKKVSDAQLTAGLGFSMSYSINAGMSYEINGEKGKRKQMQYRRYYRKYKVKQRQYTKCVGGGSTTKKYTGSTKTVYIKKPLDMEFRTVYLK